jgi:hypothetical protein
LQPGLAGSTGSTCRISWVTPGFFFPRFFFNPARFQPRGQPGLGSTCGAGPGFKSIGSSKGLKRLVQNNPDKKIANRNHSQLSNKTSNKTKQEAGRKMLITLARNALK